MTRNADNAHSSSDADADLLAGLWEEAPFARLPWDAPPELKEMLVDIENPRRVYAVHRATRRHNFHLLVQKYIVQLRDGCGVTNCTTPTCFTCRKRIVGRAPIRRYNTTSARTLAVYLASQDNAENGLCTTLQLPKAAPATFDSLIFSPKHASRPRDERRPRPSTAQNGHARTAPQKKWTDGAKGRPHVPTSQQDGKNIAGQERPASPQENSHFANESFPAFSRFSVAERVTSKDYRSFAANMFGTVAFKMLEWLTPSGVEDLSERAQGFQGKSRENGSTVLPASKNGTVKARTRPASPVPRSESKEAGCGNHEKINGAESTAEQIPAIEETADSVRRNGSAEKENSAQPVVPPTWGNNQRRNSNARVRASNSTKSKRKLSIDTFPPDVATDEILPGLRSPRIVGLQAEKNNTRQLKTATATIPRPISQLSNAGYFDGVTLERMPSPKSSELRSRMSRGQTDGIQNGHTDTPRRPPSSSASQSPDASGEKQPPAFNPDLESTYDILLPQSLSRLNSEVIDFACDVLQEDHTSEPHLLEPTTITRFHTRFASQPKPLKRRQKPRRTEPDNLRLEWQLFTEQSFFYILSDPHLVIRSFTKNGLLYDSQTLWYCMLRMTRVAPSLVFHALWMAAEILFAPPKAIQSLRSPTARLFPKQERALSNTEAGTLMAICLHALVAAAPLVSDSRQLYDMSRIRSHGLSLAGSGAIAKPPLELCLQYEDAFSNNLAIRLARRLFTAITTRGYFDEMIEHDASAGDEAGKVETDILSPLFAQLDFLNMDAVYILNFSFHDRTLHETRVPTLLLDWARTVMLNEWDGQPEVPGDGSFGGALALIEAMYKKRQALLLGDSQFRSDYFAERFDEVEMPIAWLSFASTRQKLHLLDFPYIFNSATLVSYFRSINFSRMSRSFEESSSLQSRMTAIMQPGSLIVNQHHKNVLRDLLQTASSKYLVLDIGRKNVIGDAFDQLWRREERELMRPLKVHLGEDSGEEGFDSGGVQQEFFRLAIAEALNPDYGAFTVDERTRMVWFRPGSVEADWRFELIGLLMSLAIYNGLTLPITFPKALYRKLLGEPVTELHHIDDGWPELASGLTTLLEWDEKDGAVQDIFARTYEFSVEMLGQHVSREMNNGDAWPQVPKHAWLAKEATPAHDDNPADAPLVTHENRNAYVSDYIRYLTDVSVRPQYEAFERGFRTCLHPKSLTLLTSSLLQSVVEGQQDIDMSELKMWTRYVGWDARHRTVKDFWSIVKRYDDRMKRKLLEFVTASDRVPVGGMKNLQFVVQRNGEEEGSGGHLPTAYTCYGTLLLPEYRDKEVLKERLAMALENAQGFGFA